jgi:hypothetical protein
MASSCSHAVQRKLGMHWNPLPPKGGRNARMRKTTLSCTTDPLGYAASYPFSPCPLKTGYKPSASYTPRTGYTAEKERRIYRYLLARARSERHQLQVGPGA